MIGRYCEYRDISRTPGELSRVRGVNALPGYGIADGCDPVALLAQREPGKPQPHASGKSRLLRHRAADNLLPGGGAWIVRRQMSSQPPVPRWRSARRVAPASDSRIVRPTSAISSRTAAIASRSSVFLPVSARPMLAEAPRHTYSHG